MSKTNSSPGSGPVIAAERLASSLSKTLREALRWDAAGGDAIAYESALRTSTKLIDDAAALLPALRDLIPGVSERAERQYLELEAALREQCARREWRFDGQWPSFYVERAISVECDPQQRTVRVAGDKVAGATAQVVMASLEPIVATLVPKGFSGRTFLASMALSYDAVKGHTSQPPIIEVYREMVVRAQDDRFWRDARPERFKGLSGDQFRARIAHILERGETQTSDGRELKLLPPLKAGDGVFVYQPSESRFGFVGRIEFCSVARPVSR